MAAGRRRRRRPAPAFRRYRTPPCRPGGTVIAGSLRSVEPLGTAGQSLGTAATGPCAWASLEASVRGALGVLPLYVGHELRRYRGRELPRRPAAGPGDRHRDDAQRPSRNAVSRAAHSTACSDSSEQPSPPATMVLAGILSSLPDLSAIAAPAPTTPRSALASSPAIGVRSVSQGPWSLEGSKRIAPPRREGRP